MDRVLFERQPLSACHGVDHSRIGSPVVGRNAGADVGEAQHLLDELGAVVKIRMAVAGE